MRGGIAGFPAVVLATVLALMGMVGCDGRESGDRFEAAAPGAEAAPPPAEPAPRMAEADLAAMPAMMRVAAGAVEHVGGTDESQAGFN